MRRHKLFIDENLPAAIGPVIEQMFRRQLWIRTTDDEHLRGVLDVPLMEHLHLLKYDGIITCDVAQITDNPHERLALREAGLHWIGMPQPKATGISQISQISASVIAAMPSILQSWPPEPTAFTINSRSIAKASQPRLEAL